jgi:hypothetical protein
MGEASGTGCDVFLQTSIPIGKYALDVHRGEIFLVRELIKSTLQEFYDG